MALLNQQDLTVTIKLNLDIPQETIHLACNILGLYLSQNADKTLKIDRDINKEVKVYIDTIQNKQTQQALKESLQQINNPQDKGASSAEEFWKDM